MGQTDSVSSQESKIFPVLKDAKPKVKLVMYGMETDHTEQLAVLLSQSAKVLNKNWDTEETNASTTSKQENRSPSPFDNKTLRLK